MSKLETIILQLLGVPFNSGSTVAGVQSVQSNTSSQEVSSGDFSSILANLNTNLNQASVNAGINNLGYSSGSGLSNNIQTNIPDISSIIQQIQNNPNEISSVEALVENFLLNNYGGSKDAVIKNLTGVQNLPPQAQAMEDQIFSQIVTELSIQVRESVSAKNTSSDFSSLYMDDSSQNSSVDESSIV